jgi:dephospho-CoA kinase
MRVLALTGGIAEGKSTVARLLAEQGAQVASADDDARGVLTEPGAPLDAVLAAFPEARTPEGAIDRTALARRIFADPDARRRLNALIHPAVRRRMRSLIDAARRDPRSGVLIYEVPLLYEGGLETWFDAVIVAHATPQAQAERLQAREAAAGRPPLTDDEIARRLAAQLPSIEKARRADYVVRTDVPLDQTRTEVVALWAQLSSQA